MHIPAGGIWDIASVLHVFFMISPSIKSNCIVLPNIGSMMTSSYYLIVLPSIQRNMAFFATMHPTDELTTETTSTKVAAELDALQRTQGSDSASGLDSNGDLCCDLWCCTESYRKLMDFLHSKSFQDETWYHIISRDLSQKGLVSNPTRSGNVLNEMVQFGFCNWRTE